MNAAGVRNDLHGPGEVTYGEAFAVQPFSNHLVTLTLTGAQIEHLLEQQFTSSSANS
jgi:5'-nucleotidase